MALKKQSGANSILLIGVQTAEGTPVANIAGPAEAAGKMLPIRFPMTGLTFGEQSDSTESSTIIGGRRSVPSQRGQLWASGDYSFEVLPGTIRHLIRLLMNPATLPTGAKLYEDDTTATDDSPTESISLSDTDGLNDITDVELDVPSRLTFQGSAGATVEVVGKRRIGKPTL
ncbi:MAG: hypothetical protein F4166_08840, partial [Gammaproteobacteria bacterium]|nr:hypothetical protein [Gammaproteobacteria bacterium]